MGKSGVQGTFPIVLLATRCLCMASLHLGSRWSRCALFRYMESILVSSSVGHQHDPECTNFRSLKCCQQMFSFVEISLCSADLESISFTKKQYCAQWKSIFPTRYFDVAFPSCPSTLNIRHDGQGIPAATVAIRPESDSAFRPIKVFSCRSPGKASEQLSHIRDCHRGETHIGP